MLPYASDNDFHLPWSILMWKSPLVKKNTAGWKIHHFFSGWISEVGKGGFPCLPGLVCWGACQPLRLLLPAPASLLPSQHVSIAHLETATETETAKDRKGHIWSTWCAPFNWRCFFLMKKTVFFAQRWGKSWRFPNIKNLWTLRQRLQVNTWSQVETPV